MSDDTREREITRKALVLCLSHPVDCDCRGCRYIYGLLQPGEPDKMAWYKRWDTLAGRAALLTYSMDPTLQQDGKEILRRMAAVEGDIPVRLPTPEPREEQAMNDLKPCPFCGNLPEVMPWHGGGPRKTCVMCSTDDCSAGPAVTGSTKAQAIAAWNRRAEPTPDREAMADKVSGILRAVLRGDHRYRNDAKHYIRWGLVEKDLRAVILGKELDHER